ncbi:hypothetical protein ABIB68_001753 [Bradyrhizobium sp. F1.2.2]|jgi:hypothetical protein
MSVIEALPVRQGFFLAYQGFLHANAVDLE